MATAETAHDVRALEGLLLRMWQIRAFEIRAMELFEEKLIRGSVHPYVGMEAIAVGACAALGPDDYITSTHRGHGHCVAKGLDLRLMMAEIIGREDGYCRGRGGSMHITAMDKGMLGADAIVAGSSALAVGAAHGLRLQGRDSIVVCFFGDGAANQGMLHEACNLAAVLARARRVRVREQRLGDLDSGGRVDPDREHRRPRRGLRLPGRDRRRQRRRRRARRRRRGVRPRPRRRRADADRGQELPRHAALGRDEDRPPPSRGARRRGALAIRSCVSPASWQTTTGSSLPRSSEIEQQARDDVDAAVEFALASPRPEPEAAFEDVYAPAEWLAPGRLA